MIAQGSVFGLQARLNVAFRLPNRPDVQIEFVVDTGFEGALTLPPAAVAALQLPFLQEMSANLANDESVKVDVHVATIVWGADERDVTVLSMGNRPLLGTTLMQACHLGVDFADGGAVSLTNING